MAQLCQHEKQFKQLEVEVLLISFGAPEVGKLWLEEMCPSFPLLLDTERMVYRIYGLQRSWLRSWNLKTLWRYIQLLSSGRKWRGIQGDSAQLGGDFIVNTNGILHLTYRSRDPTDRPPVTLLLSLSRQLSEEQG